MTEIERKFLVISEDFRSKSYKSYHIKQGFLNTDPQRTVRVRLAGDNAFLTVKGMSSKDGLSRFEWENPIAFDDALELLKLCENSIIEKTRFLVQSNNHLFEIDVFEGDNKGLIVAEIELNSVGEKFTKPDWLGQEVTGDVRYYNAQLARVPFKDWN